MQKLMTCLSLLLGSLVVPAARIGKVDASTALNVTVFG